MDTSDQSAPHDSIIRMVSRIITKRFDKHEKRVAVLINKEIDRRVATYRRWVTAFLCGVGLLIILGFTTKESIYRVAIKAIYPPEAVYKDIKEEIAKDANLNKQLIDSVDFKQLTIRTATLDTFPEISHEIPDKVWRTIQSGNEDDYRKIVNKAEFYNALREYHSELIKTFIIPQSNRLGLKQKILDVGRNALDVQILMLAKGLDKQQTAVCHQQFLQNELHAIVVVPNSLPPEEYSWFRCDFGWPNIYLTLHSQGSSLDDIRLVGVRRDGKSSRLIVIVSSRVAERLNLPGWKSYDSNTYGTLTIGNVDDD